MTYHSNQTMVEHALMPRLSAFRSFAQVRGVGQILTMDPQIQAALKKCSDDCESKYGVTSGMPDVIALTACFASCDTQNLPTVQLPGTTTPSVPGTPSPDVPQVVPGVLPEPEPAPTPPPATSKASSMTPWLIGGAIAAVAVVAVVATRK